MNKKNISTSISYNTSKAISKLPPHMFGANLEHIGEAIYNNGIWSETIKNRKFCGPDKLVWNNALKSDHLDFGVVQPWKSYNPSGKHVMYAHSNYEYIVKGNETKNRYGSGKQSQYVSIRKKSVIKRGIQQNLKINNINDTHTFTIVLKGKGQKVFISIGEIKFSIISKKNWSEFKKNIKFKSSNSSKKLSISILDKEIYIANCSLMPKDTIFGFRKDISEMIKKWRPSYIRWPGGNFLSGYNWINGIGNKNYRLPYYDFAWHSWESNDVGTDEFMQWCEYIGSEPMITVNTGDGTVEEATSWIEYCTGDNKTKYGKLRISNGRKKPYNLKTIFVGNEMFGGWQIGHTDAKTYAKTYDDFVKKIKKINNQLKFIVVGCPVDHFGHWNEIVLKNIKEQADQISVHYYSIRTEKDKIHPHYKTRYLPTIAASTEVEIMLDRTIKEIKRYTKKNIDIAFDEWNTYVEAHHPYYIENYNIADALYAASLLHACLNRSHIIKNTGIYHLINVMGNYRIKGNKIWKTPTTLVLELLAKFHKGDILKIKVKSDTIASPKLGKQPSYTNVKLIDAACSNIENQTCISLVNKSPNKKIIVKLPKYKKIIENYVINGNSPTDLNTELDRNKIKIKKNIIKFLDYSAILLPHSFNLIVLKH